MNSPILITGAARSGTSLVAGVINKCGAFGGLMSRGNRYNEKGMFENAFIRDKLEKPYLTGLGLDRLGQYPLAETENLSIPADWKKKVQDIMIKEGYKEGPWMYKGAKACQIWPVWNYAFPNAKWIIVRRRSADIATSCLNTGFMQRFSDPKIQSEIGVTNEYDGWIWWIREHEKKFVEMIQAGLNVKIVWPDRMVDRGDYTQMIDAIEWLGLEWRDKEIMSFVEPKLWKARKKQIA